MKREYGTGTVERVGKRFRARFWDPNGVRVTVGIFATEIEAGIALDDAIAKVQSPTIMHGGITLQAYGEAWLKRRSTQVCRARAYESRWNAHVKPWECAGWPVKMLTPVQIRDWRDGLLRANVKPGYCQEGTVRPPRKLARQTIQNALNMLRVCLEAAVEDGIISTNPARGVRLPPKERGVSRDPWTWLDEREQATVLDNCPEHDWPFAAFAFGTGVRLGEEQSLELVDVHDDSPHPHVVIRYGGYDGAPTKGKRPRIVPLFGIALEAVRRQREWLASNPNDHGLLFPAVMGGRREAGHHPEWFDRLRVKHKLRGQTGVRVTWHSLRHTCASRLVSGAWGQSWSLEEIAGLLGHKELKTCQRYAHLAPTALFRAAAATQAALERPTSVHELRATSNSPKIAQ